MTIADKVASLFEAGVYRTNSLYSSAGGVDNALVVEPLQANIELVIGKDLEVRKKEDLRGNIEALAREVVAPRIKRPTAICEITSLT